MSANGGGRGLQASEARVLVDAVIDTIHDPILVLDHELRIFCINEAFLELSGLSRAETEGCLLREIERGTWDLPELRELLARPVSNEEVAHDIEVTHDFDRVGRRTLLLNARRIDPLDLVLLVIEDITARAAAHEHRRLLLAELQHRVKNTLALVQSVAVHTGRGSPSIEQFMIAFGERLRTLGHVHDLVIRTESSGADLRTLVEQTLAFQRVKAPDAIEIEGETIHLNAEQGQTLGLALHELTSNATRHGALTVPAGHVRIAWHSELHDAARWLRLSWQESGGPKVTAPGNAGFGRTVLEGACAYELAGSADLRFEPDGLRYELAFPLA